MAMAAEGVKQFSEQWWEDYIGKIIGYTCLGLLLLMVTCGSLFTVSAGEVGVTFNKITGITQSYSQGTYFKMPIITNVTDFDVKTQKEDIKASSASKDLQKVEIDVVINYHLDYTKVNELYVKVGEDFSEKVIYPAVYEAVKAASAQFPVEQIIVEREKLKQIIEDLLQIRLAKYNIILESVNLIDITFDKEFSAVVEQKQMEEQKIKTAEYIKLQAQQRKEATILEAQGEAEKQRLLRATTSKEVIALKWIEAWEKGGAKMPTTLITDGNKSGTMLMLPVSGN
jgi:prohibitin 2